MSKGQTEYGYGQRFVTPLPTRAERVDRVERIKRHILIADAVRSRPPAHRNLME